MQEDAYPLLRHQRAILRAYDDAPAGRNDGPLREPDRFCQYTALAVAKILLAIARENRRDALTALLLDECINVEQG